MTKHQLLPLAGLAVTMAISAGCVVQLAGSQGEPPLIAGGTFEASGLASVPGSQGVLFVDDGQDKQVYWMELDANGNQVGTAIAVPLGADIVDPEGITASATHYYIVGSQSKKGGNERDGLVRFTFAEANRTVSGVERISGLKAWLTAQVPELRDARALNIEGLAWDPAGKRLLLGLRAPVVDGQALVIPLSLIDPAGAFAIRNLQVDGGKAIRVPLGGAGIRSMEYDHAAKAYQVIAASEGSDVFRLVEWDGAPGSTTREITTFPKRLKPEGVSRVSLGGKTKRVVVFDTSRVAVLD